MTALDRLWGFQEVEAPRFQDSRYMKVVRLSAVHTGHLYSQEIFSVLISVRSWVNSSAIMWLEGLGQWKIPVTPSGMETATSRLVAQCINKLRHQVPNSEIFERNSVNVCNVQTGCFRLVESNGVHVCCLYACNCTLSKLRNVTEF
jgi:hypothetical protein